MARASKRSATDGSNDFTLSQNASSTQSGQTYQGVFGALALTAGSTNGTTTVTVASTAGMQNGMLVMMPGVPNGATVTSVTNSAQFVISQAATATASGLAGYAQLPFAMPALLTSGETFTTPGNTDKVTVASTAGLVPGLTLAGPNLKSGTKIKTVVNSTDLRISTETLADGSGLTFIVGQPSYLPLTMVRGCRHRGLQHRRGGQHGGSGGRPGAQRSEHPGLQHGVVGGQLHPDHHERERHG